jgi:hypothetical protein
MVTPTNRNGATPNTTVAATPSTATTTAPRIIPVPSSPATAGEVGGAVVINRRSYASVLAQAETCTVAAATASSKPVSQKAAAFTRVSHAATTQRAPRMAAAR